MTTTTKLDIDQTTTEIAVYRNHDERLGEECLFTLSIMTACYRDNGWDVRDGERMTDAEIEANILGHNVEFVGNWTAEQIANEMEQSR